MLRPEALAQSGQKVLVTFEKGGGPFSGGPSRELKVRIGSPELERGDDFILIAVEEAPADLAPIEMPVTDRPDGARRARPGRGPSATSKWNLRQVVGKEAVEGSPIHCITSFEPTDKVTQRSLDLSAAPLSRKEVFGLVKARYLLVYFKPKVIVWDLEEDKIWSVLEADDVVLFGTDRSRTAAFAPKGESEIMGDRFEWKLMSQEDLAPKPEYKVVPIPKAGP